MSNHPLELFEVPNRVLKRAQYEAFEFELLGTDVLVRNGSHARPTDHEYVVIIKDGLPVACPCPADDRFDHPCKHRTAIVIRPLILTFASEVQRIEDGDVTEGLPMNDGPAVHR